jgi:hypothetical protein
MGAVLRLSVGNSMLLGREKYPGSICGKEAAAAAAAAEDSLTLTPLRGERPNPQIAKEP